MRFNLLLSNNEMVNTFYSFIFVFFIHSVLHLHQVVFFNWIFVNFLPFFSDSGSASIDIQAPHTITDWIANAFCLSPENGLGVAPATSLTTFQPFFLSFSLPYSVIRGENVPIKISVFNYLDSCLVVRYIHLLNCHQTTGEPLFIEH